MIARRKKLNLPSKPFGTFWMAEQVLSPLRSISHFWSTPTFYRSTSCKKMLFSFWLSRKGTALIITKSNNYLLKSIKWVRLKKQMAILHRTFKLTFQSPYSAQLDWLNLRADQQIRTKHFLEQDICLKLIRRCPKAFGKEFNWQIDNKQQVSILMHPRILKRNHF